MIDIINAGSYKMRTVTIEKDLYQFSELSATAKEKALGEFSAGADHGEVIGESIANLIETAAHEFKNLDYSFSYSQGDGLCFELYSLNLDTLVNSPYFKEHKKSHITLFIDLFDYCVTWSRINPHYSHYNSYSIDLNIFKLREYFGQSRNYSDRLIDLLQDLVVCFIEYYKDFNRIIEASTYEEIEYLESSEHFTEICDINSFEFDINGNLH